MSSVKRRFDKYVATQPLEAHNVYGDSFSIKLDMKEVQKQGFSRILGQYVNEQKAHVEDEFAYIMPTYDTYHIRRQNYKKQKLLQYVAQKNFLSMLNQADICVEVEEIGKKKIKKFFFKISQDNIKKHQCMPIVALLIDSGLAHIGNQDNNLYIAYDYQNKLEQSSKIQTDLSHFRTLLGESNNLAALIALIEGGEIEDRKVIINKSAITDEEMNIEMMSLVDLGWAEFKEGKYEIEVNFASWLLDYISTTSDRISFGNMYVGQ